MEKIDEIIKEELKDKADLFNIPEDMSERISFQIQQEQKERKSKMFKMNKKKAVLLVACVVMVLGCASMAAGKVVGIVSHSSNIPTYTQYSDLSKAEKKVGVTTYAPESFTNGFMFKGIYVAHSERMDEQNQVMAEYDYLEMEYKKDKTRVMLNVEPYDTITGEQDFYSETEVNGVNCYYTTFENKFVPLDYEPTDEEKKAMEEGRLNIGYGTDEIETSISMQICWLVDGNTYSLFYMDEEPVLSMDDLMKMAEECIGK